MNKIIVACLVLGLGGEVAASSGCFGVSQKEGLVPSARKLVGSALNRVAEVAVNFGKSSEAIEKREAMVSLVTKIEERAAQIERLLVEWHILLARPEELFLQQNLRADDIRSCENRLGTIYQELMELRALQRIDTTILRESGFC